MSGYGAINAKEEGQLQENSQESSFEEYNTAFLKERQLTRAERIVKLCTAGLPIVIALLVMTCFGLLVSKAVAPSPQHHGTATTATTTTTTTATAPLSTIPGSTTSTHVPLPPSSPVTAAHPKFDSVRSPPTPASPRSNSTTKGTDSDMECVANPACSKMKLTGYCCPTMEGVYLDCCR